MLNILTENGTIIALMIGLLGILYALGMHLYWQFGLKGPNVFKELLIIVKEQYKSYLKKGIFILIFTFVIAIALTILVNIDVAKFFALGIVISYLVGFINLCYKQFNNKLVEADLLSSTSKTIGNGTMYRLFVASLSFVVFMLVYIYLGDYELVSSNNLSLVLFAFAFGSVAVVMFIGEEQKWTKFYAFNIVIMTFTTYICTLNNASDQLFTSTYPCLIMAIVVLGALISNFVLTRSKEDYEKSRQDVIYLSALILVIGVFGISYLFYNMDFFKIFLPTIVGAAFGIVYNNFVSAQVQSPKDGNLLLYITKGMNGIFVSFLFVAVVLFIAFTGSDGTESSITTMIKGAYGVMLAIISMQSSRFIQNDKEEIKENNNEINSLIMFQFVVAIILVIQGNEALSITNMIDQLSLANPLMYIGLILGGGVPIATFRRYMENKDKGLKIFNNIVISVCIPIIVGLLIGVSGLIVYLIGNALTTYILTLIINGAAASYQQNPDNDNNPFVGAISSRMMITSLIINLVAILFFNLYVIAEAGNGLISLII